MKSANLCLISIEVIFLIFAVFMFSYFPPSNIKQIEKVCVKYNITTIESRNDDFLSGFIIIIKAISILLIILWSYTIIQEIYFPEKNNKNKDNINEKT